MRQGMFFWIFQGFWGISPWYLQNPWGLFTPKVTPPAHPGEFPFGFVRTLFLIFRDFGNVPLVSSKYLGFFTPQMLPINLGPFKQPGFETGSQPPIPGVSNGGVGSSIEGRSQEPLGGIVQERGERAYPLWLPPGWPGMPFLAGPNGLHQKSRKQPKTGRSQLTRMGWRGDFWSEESPGILKIPRGNSPALLENQEKHPLEHCEDAL